MTIAVWCEIVCDACSNTAPGRFVTNTVPKRDMIEDARRHGWRINRDTSFCSKHCEDNHEP